VISRNYIQILISIFLVITCCSASFHYALASTPKTINITRNYQEFIDLQKYPDFAKLYHSGEIKLNVTPETNVQVIEKDTVLVFWVLRWVAESSSNLEISVRDMVYSFPINVNIKRYVLDFDIREDIFELSLQEKSLSCESAAAADILESFTAKNIHEDSVIELLPKWSHYNSLPEEHPWDVVIWGNPELGFVWHIDSTNNLSTKQKLMTWYWVYEAPVSDVYRDYWLYTQIFNSSHHTAAITPEFHLLYILEKLKSWSMVQLWWDWCTKLEYDDWVLENKSLISSLPASKFISAKNTCHNVDENRDLTWKYYNTNWKLVKHTGLDGEHAFILLWWKWNINKPSHIRVWDTDTWYHLYPTHEWMRKWEAMDYRSIIISKKDS
jgi:hypothetical protein